MVPTFVQLLLNTCCVVYMGCLLSTRLSKDKEGKLVSFSKELDEDQSVISMKEAKQFPLVASCFLFGIYVLFKVLPK